MQTIICYFKTVIKTFDEQNNAKLLFDKIQNTILI